MIEKQVSKICRQHDAVCIEADAAFVACFQGCDWEPGTRRNACNKKGESCVMSQALLQLFQSCDYLWLSALHHLRTCGHFEALPFCSEYFLLFESEVPLLRYQT